MLSIVSTNIAMLTIFCLLYRELLKASLMKFTRESFGEQKDTAIGHA